MISCSEAVQRLWDYLEHEVAEPDRAAVEEHLAFCRRCCGEFEFAEELRGMLGAAAEVELPTEVAGRLTATLDALEGGDATGPPQGDAQTRTRPGGST